jgi:malate dehydrogenase
MAKSKVTVVGAGNVGGTTAQRLAERNYADVVLVDIVEGLPQGKALDILQSGPILGFDSNVTGTNGYEDTAGSDVVVITSGSPRKPGMSRDDLLKTNQHIVSSVTGEIVEHSPEAILVMVANPLDAMCHVAMETSGFPRERVVGMAGILDTARYRTFIAQELGVSVRDVFALVLGGHGDTMVPLPSMATVGGVAITELLPEDRVEAIVDRTRNGGAEIVGLLQSGSAFYAPSAAAVEMVDAILLDQKRVLPCAAHLRGEYGIDELFVGVPVKLGASGLEEIVELDLREDELADLKGSADSVRELVQVLLGEKASASRVANQRLHAPRDDEGNATSGGHVRSDRAPCCAGRRTRGRRGGDLYSPGGGASAWDSVLAVRLRGPGALAAGRFEAGKRTKGA